MQAEENAGAGGAAEDESSNDENLEVRNLTAVFTAVKVHFQASCLLL